MAPPRKGWVLLSTHVHDVDSLEAAAAAALPHRENNEPSPSPKTSDRAAIKCATTRAPTVDADKALVDGLTLLACAVEPPAVSALALRLRSEQYGFDARAYGVAHVVAADDRIVVLHAKFRGCSHVPERFLVYDAADASLAAVPPLCRMVCAPIVRSQPLPVYRHAQKDGGYALAIMARHYLYDEEARQECTREVLCLWPPPSSSSPFKGSLSPWGFKLPLFPPEKPSHLWAHAAFSFQGRAYWVDLGQGLLSCDSHDVLSGGHEVPFRYVPLPPECRVCQLCSNIDHKWSRAISCCSTTAGDGGCIKLVCIGKGHVPYESCDMCGGPEASGDMAVTAWALDLATGQWRRDDGGEDLRVAILWEMESFKAAELPQVEPTLPILITPDDGGGGVLCFSLQAEGSGPVHLCRLDMHTRTLLPSPGLLKKRQLDLLGCHLFKHANFATMPMHGE